jgi:hypothetical protein
VPAGRPPVDLDPVILSSLDFVSDLPPFLQLAAVGFLGAFSALSVAGRCWPRLGRQIWDPERDPGSFDHLATYTLGPLVLFVIALVTVARGWQSDRPLFDGMSPPLWWTLDGLVLGLGLVAIAQILKRRMDLSDGRKLSSWIPLALLLGGLVLLAVSTLRISHLLRG